MEKKKIKISVVTSVYNQDRFIQSAIESVLNQDYDNIEYVIIDGKSIDNTISIINRYKDKIDVFISEKDNGLYDGLNKGILHATGDYVGFVHADDLFYNNHVISDVVKTIEKTDCDVFYGNGIFTQPENIYVVVRNWISGKFARWKLKIGWLPLHTTMYIRRDTYLKYGLYNANYKIAGDTDLLLRYLSNKSISVAYNNMYVIRMRMGGMSTNVTSSADKWKEDIRAYTSNGFLAVTLIGKILHKVPQYICNRSFYSYLKMKVIQKLKKIIYKK